MKKVACIAICLIPLILSAQEISVYGNRGMFLLQYAQPHKMGMFSFNLSPSERFEQIETIQNGQTVTDRKHFFDISTGISYSIIDNMEIRVSTTVLTKWFEMNNYPVSREDPYPVIGFKSVKIGTKIGYPFIMDEVTPLLYAIGIDGYVDLGPGLSKTMFKNAFEQDRQFYEDSFPDAGGTPYAPRFSPHIPHDPDFGFTGLFDFRIGPFATHANAGYLLTGEDEQPEYVSDADFARLERPNYIPHGIGIELIPAEATRILFETYGMYDTDASEESLWVTPGLRFGAKSVSFDLGVDLGLINPSDDDDFWWRAFINFSAGVDLVKEVEVHIPIAKVSGRIYDATTGEPVPATLTFPGTDKETIQASAIGEYDVSFSPGSYSVRADAPEYRWKEQGIVLKDGDHVVLNFALNKKPISKVIGKIMDAETKNPIVAEITFPRTEFKGVTSDTAGMYSATLTPGTYRIRVEATGYQFDEKVVTLGDNESKVVDIALTKIGVAQATLTGKVSDSETGDPLLAQITFLDTNIPKVATDASGIYKVTIPPGVYSAKVEAQDYVMETAPVVLAKDETKIQNFKLRPVPKVGERIVLKGIYFDFNSAVIKPTSYPVLDDAARVLKAKPKMRVEISGHTDSIGSDTYNQKLSYQRANAVKDYLMRYHNIESSKLVVVGYGESQPIADNRTKAGRDLNRRIEFKILSWE